MFNFKKSLLAATLLTSLLSSAAAQINNPTSIAGGVTPTTCSTTQVLYALVGAVACNANFTNVAGNIVASASFQVPSAFVAGQFGFYLRDNGSNPYALGSGNIVAWTSSTDSFSQSYDVGFARNGAGVIEINNGVKGTVTGGLKLGLVTDATHTDRTVCQDTTTLQLFFGSGAVGICLGTSSMRFKHNIAPLETGLQELLHLETITYHYNEGYGDPAKKLYGFTAEQVHTVIPELVGLDNEGRPNSVDWAGLVPVLVRAIQQQQVEINALKQKFN